MEVGITDVNLPSVNVDRRHPSPYLTDRSRMLTHQRCPRARFLQYEFDQRGLEPNRVAIPLATGGAFHEGVAEVVNGHGVEQGVAVGQEFLRRVAAERGLVVEELESESEVFAEQLALTEALVRLAGLRVIPELTRRLGPALPEWTEREITRELGPGVVLMSRPDGLVLAPEADGLPGGHYILSWKTAASYDGRKAADARVDMQGLSESFAIEPELGVPVAGVQMIYLVKGRRLPDRRVRGLWVQHSPLIRGWKRNDGFAVHYAWTYEWSEEDPETGAVSQRRLGKGWVPFAVHREMGVASWMSMLAAGAVQPEAGECLDRQYVLPMPYVRQESDVARWRRQVAAQESRVVNSYSRKLSGPVAITSTHIDVEFPQHSHSCAYPSRCPMWEICWGASVVAEDPLASGLYRLRTPNHPTEQRLTQIEDAA